MKTHLRPQPNRAFSPTRRSVSMGTKNANPLSFHEILLEKMAGYESVEKTYTEGVIKPEKPFFNPLENLFSFGPRYEFKKKNGFPLEKKASRPPKIKKSEAVFTTQQLSVAAQLALKTLHLDGYSQLKISDVKRAFRRFARDFHPDLQAAAGQPQISSTEKFIALKAAADIVLDELRRETSTSEACDT